MSIENLKYFAAGEAGGGSEKGPDKGKESLDINQLQKDFEDLSKIEKLERKDIEPDLDKVLDILQNEPENIRPKDKNGQPGGLIELKKNIPTLLIPDLHGKREILLKILNDKDEQGITNLEKIIKNKLQIVFLGDVVHTFPSEDQETAQKEFMQSGKFTSSAMDKEIAASFGTVKMIMKLKELAPENVHYLRGDHEIQNEAYGFRVGKGKIYQSSLVKNYFKQYYGDDFLQKYDQFEEGLPFLVIGDKFFASHTIPGKPFSKEEIINFHSEVSPQCKDKKDFFKQLTFSRPSDALDYNKNPEQYVAERFKALNGNIQGWIYFYGHTMDEFGWGDHKTPICGLDSNYYFVTSLIKDSQNIEFRNYKDISDLDESRAIHSFDALQNPKIHRKITIVKETKPEEPQQTPEQLLKKRIEGYLDKQLRKDASALEIMPFENYDIWHEKIRNTFKNLVFHDPLFDNLPKNKQAQLFIEYLENKLRELSQQQQEIEKKLKDPTIRGTEKQSLGLKQIRLQYLEEATQTRLRIYNQILEELLKKEPKKEAEETAGKEEKTPETQPTQQPEKPLTKEEAEKIKKHFQEELKKVEDLPQDTEIKKWRKINECLRLLNDWLPFGRLDNFEGLDKLMSVLEGSKSKLRISYPLIQENASRKIALEMAFQYKFWEANDQEKISKINNFIDTWLKEKSIYYQKGEEFKNILKPPPKYLEQRAKWGYSIGEPSKKELEEEPDKISQWFVDQASESLKLLGERDRTLNQISQILALQNIPYAGIIDQLTKNINNKNVQFNSVAQIRAIEEWQDTTKLKYLMNFKARLGTLPTMPLKIEYQEKLIEEEAKNLKPEDKAILMAILEGYETGIKDKQVKERLEQLKNKISGLVEKEKETPKPEVIKKATEFIKKEEGKGKDSILQKIGGWETIGGIIGFSLFMFLILILFGELKLFEKAANLNIDLGGGGKGKK